MRLAAALLAAGLAAGPAAAEVRSHVTREGAVRVVAGEKVTVRLSHAIPPEIVKVEAVSDAEALPPKPGQGQFADPPAGAVVLVLGREGERLHLKLESGVVQAFDYRARLVGPDALQPVAACTVLPLLANYEQWSTPATEVEIAQVRFRATNEVVCSGPEGAR